MNVHFIVSPLYFQASVSFMGNSENVDKTKNDKQGESKQKYKEHLYTEKGCRVVYFVRFFFFSNKTLIKF